MNRTLFDCGFKKEVELKGGQLYEITATLSKSVKLNSKSLKCDVCQEFFTGKQYLDAHVRFKHNIQVSESPYSSNKLISHGEGKVSDDDAAFNMHETCEISANTQGACGIIHPARPTPERRENRRGRIQRKSYTVEFKKQTLDLLDSLSTSKNKWSKVGKARGLSRSLVVKWNKDRRKILEQLALNKQNKNTDSIRAARQRKKILGETKHREKYPLSANLLVVEFKLRRATGSKVSKIWFRKKMKSKNEIKN
jgi:hypothetical protein